MGCQTSKKHIIGTNQSSQLQTRSFQTKTYSGVKKLQAIRGIIEVLQDLGFVIDDGNMLTGVVSATKLDGYVVKITISVRDKKNGVRIRAVAQFGDKPILNPKIYQDFFTALNKGLFLEKHLLSNVDTKNDYLTDNKIRIKVLKVKNKKILVQFPEVISLKKQKVFFLKKIASEHDGGNKKNLQTYKNVFPIKIKKQRKKKAIFLFKDKDATKVGEYFFCFTREDCLK